jgi:hypothetical protein
MTAYRYTICDNKYGGLGTRTPKCSDPQNEPDFPERVSQRGSEFPLVMDVNHNFGRRPSDPLFVIALRLGGHINSRYVADYERGLGARRGRRHPHLALGVVGNGLKLQTPAAVETTPTTAQNLPAQVIRDASLRSA